MAKLWTGNKTWQGNTTPVAGTKYLVGAASGKCSYQTFEEGQTKRCLVSNGANGNIAYQNVTRPVEIPKGSSDLDFSAWDINNISVAGNTDKRYGTSSWDNTNKRFLLSAPTGQGSLSQRTVVVVAGPYVEDVNSVKRIQFWYNGVDYGTYNINDPLAGSTTSGWDLIGFSVGGKVLPNTVYMIPYSSY